MIKTRDLRWSWHGQDVVLGLDEAGSGRIAESNPVRGY
jgi:hypothetical protein